MATIATAPAPSGARAQSQPRPGAGRAAAALPGLAPIARLFWVAPWGSDSARGTQEAPFATIDHARQQVQALLPLMRGDVVIVLRGGRYPLSSTLAFSSADSGTGTHRVRYVAAQGETPIVAGGVPITAWRQEDSPSWLWSAPLPSAFARLSQPAPRQIYVNGVRASRVRGPWPSGGGVLTQTASGYSGLNPLSGWRNPQDIEFVYRVVFQEQRARVAAQSASAITMADADSLPWTAVRTMWGAGTLPAGPPTFVEHAYELLASTSGGQFWVDTAGARIYYVPRSDEVMRAASVLAPALDALVLLDGVANVSFEGLTFAEGSWTGVNQTGLAEVGGNEYFASGADFAGWRASTLDGFALEPFVHTLPAAVQAQGCTGCAWTDCTFVRLGGSGLSLGPNRGRASDLHSDCTGCTIAGCSFSDVSANGIFVRGGTGPTNTNHITGCTAHDCDLEYGGGEGMSLYMGAGSMVEHNLIYNIPYNGLNMRQGGTAQDNRIHDCMQNLVDGGAIYTYGPSVGLVFRRNLVSQTRSYGPGGLLYCDNASTNKTWQNNVVQMGAASVQAFFSNDQPGPTVVSYNWSDQQRAQVASGVGPLAMNRLISPSAPAPASVAVAAGPAAAPPAQCSAPLGLATLSADPPHSTLTLGWSAPTSGQAVFYEVWADDLIVGTTTGLSFTFADLAPARTYVFAVRAVDAGGGVSVPSAPLCYVAPPSTVARSSYGTGWE